ncbi:ATP-grasp domain-containing protein, partial [Candidatus Gracilibacteria bacterium]|nr:ATP-grasp domain-containing protein [Candidatus Gracilibacteria bacterium]
MGKFMTYFSITSQTIIAEAKKLGFQTEILQANKNFYVIRGNGKEVYFKSNDFGGNTALGYKISDDKELTTIILDKNGYKTPKSIYIGKKDLKYFNIEKTSLGFPLVTKPIDQGHGNGVTVGIESKDELNYGIKESLKYGDHFIIQEFIKGEEYRILVIGDKVILGIKRIPAHIIGDGVHTIKELIEIENKNPLRGKGYESSLTYIEIDKKLINYIGKKGLKLDTI